MELAKVKTELQSEHSDHDSLRTTLGVVGNDLGMNQSEEVSSVTMQALGIMDHVRELAQIALHFGI